MRFGDKRLINKIMIERIRREEREKNQAEMVKLLKLHKKAVIQKLFELLDTEKDKEFIKEEIPRLIEREFLDINYSLNR